MTLITKHIKNKKPSPCRDSNLKDAALQHSALRAEPQCWLVKLRQTAKMNAHIYIYLHIYFRTPASRVYFGEKESMLFPNSSEDTQTPRHTHNTQGQGYEARRVMRPIRAVFQH